MNPGISEPSYRPSMFPIGTCSSPSSCSVYGLCDTGVIVLEGQVYCAIEDLSAIAMIGIGIPILGFSFICIIVLSFIVHFFRKQLQFSDTH
jgi:hypothetical protein